MQLILKQKAEIRGKILQYYPHISFSISEPMTKEETARKFSKENGVSYKKAFVTLYPDEYKINRLIAKGMSSDTTRELAVGLPVKRGQYYPHISFYCYTSE